MVRKTPTEVVRPECGASFALELTEAEPLMLDAAPRLGP